MVPLPWAGAQLHGGAAMPHCEPNAGAAGNATRSAAVVGEAEPVDPWLSGFFSALSYEHFKEIAHPGMFFSIEDPSASMFTALDMTVHGPAPSPDEAIALREELTGEGGEGPGLSIELLSILLAELGQSAGERFVFDDEDGAPPASRRKGGRQRNCTRCIARHCRCQRAQDSASHRDTPSVPCCCEVAWVSEAGPRGC